MRKRWNRPSGTVQAALESHFDNGAPSDAKEFLTYDDFVQLLDLHSVLPPEVDEEHVAAILLAGFLNPTSNGAPRMGSRYHQSEFVHRKARSKLHGKFQGDQYATAIDWLRKQRIIILPKQGRNSTVFLSLNPHVRDAKPDGRPVVERINRFAVEVLASR